MKPHSKPAATRPLRDKLRDAAHDAILDAAEEALAKYGLEAPMEKIAARAGVAVGTLYNHFESRAALLEALLETRRKELVEAISDAVAQSEGQGFHERLLLTLRAVVAATEAQLGFRRLLLQSDLAVKPSGRTATLREVAQIFSRLLDEGRKEGALAADPDRIQPLFVAALLRAAFAATLDSPARLPLSRIPEVVAEQFLGGAGPRP